MRFPKIWLVLFSLAVIWPAHSQQNFTYEIKKDIPSPLFTVFDPLKADNQWVSISDPVAPDHASGTDAIRAALDAQRMSKLKGPASRQNYSGNPTNPAGIAPKKIADYTGGAGGGTPNDNHLAVGNDGKFINVLNTVIRAHNADGSIVRAWNIEYFANPPNKKIDPVPTLTRVFDPRVIYDPAKDRYILLFMHGTTDVNSFIVVAFSTTNNPTDPWNVYKIPGKPTKDSIWSDYPIVAHNAEDFFFTVNLIRVGASWEEGFTEAVIWQIRKEDGFNGDTLHKNVYTNIKYEGKALRSICSIQNGPIPTGTDNYFVTVKPLALKNDSVFLLRINNTQKSGKAALEMKVLRTETPYGFPPSALQPDTSYKLRTNDVRALSGIRTGNTIQFLQNTNNFNTLQAHLTHNTIYNISGNAYIRGGLITDDSLDMGYPAIAPATDNPNDPSAVITFVYSSPWHYPGTAVIYVNRYGEYSKIVKIKEGQSLIYYNYIPKGEQRWGDYEGIQAKFNEPGVFYLVGSYGVNNGMSAWIARIELKDSLRDDPLAQVKVFPVPTRNDIFTEIQVVEEGNYGFLLYDMLGKKVFDKLDYPLQGGTHLLRIDQNNLSPGNYFIHVISPSGKIIHKQKIQLQ